jgi:hypothetical protein
MKQQRHPFKMTMIIVAINIVLALAGATGAFFWNVEAGSNLGLQRSCWLDIWAFVWQITEI